MEKCERKHEFRGRRRRRCQCNENMQEQDVFAEHHISGKCVNAHINKSSCFIDKFCLCNFSNKHMRTHPLDANDVIGWHRDDSCWLLR